jgi:hypothetical protein
MVSTSESKSRREMWFPREDTLYLAAILGNLP